MSPTRLLPLAGVALLGGCTLVSRAVYNVEYSQQVRADLDELHEEHRRLAGEAWLEYWAGCGRDVTEPGLADGFIDGFADYLDRGGPAGPPAVPPNEYRFGDAHSPAGRAAAARYAEGFAAGARAARDSGLRVNSIVPVFLPVAAPDTAGPVFGSRPPALPGPPEILPPARPVPPEAAPPAPPADTGRALPPAGP